MEEKREQLDVILKEITAGLTFDPKEDAKYLTEQMEKYKEHELSKEILRACGRLLYDTMSDDTKEKLNQAFQKDDLGTEATIEEARFSVYKGDWNKALRIMEDLIEKIEAAGLFHDDIASAYINFNEPFEAILYNYSYKPKKEVKHAPLPLEEIYYLYGAILVELQRFEDAKCALKKALHWNPMSRQSNFEYAEIFKMTGEYDEFFRLTVDIFKIAFRSNEVARCYRNLGYYFVEKELYDEAAACYYLSTMYEPDSKQAMSELYYISTKTNRETVNPSREEVEKYSEEYCFPIGADDDVIGLSNAFGEQSYILEEYARAAYFWDITYELTDDEEIGKKLEEITTKLN